MKRIMTFGVFDYFHIGHLKLFEKCKEYGDYLIVGVQNGEYVSLFKPDQKILYTTEERVEMVEALRIVDEVFVYDTLVPAVVEKTEFDILALGEYHTGGRFDVLEKWCREHGKSVVRLKRTPDISSTLIKRNLLEQYARKKEETHE